MHNDTNKFNTSIVNLKDVDKYRFTIPTYQRPYVWGNDQLKKLLDDFYVAFNNNPEEAYYVSSFLTKETDNTAELIDGQQRFTSLWLIAFVISNICPKSEITKFLKINNQPRFNFEIRTEVLNYLESLTDSEGGKTKKESNQIENQPYVINIAKGLTFIRGYFETKIGEENNIEVFGKYIYNNVKLIKNTTPKNTDLNKLFSTINSAGLQLEQTDIVKANLLNLIDEKVKYGKIWEACENMNNFFERNAKASFPKSDWKSINLNNHIPYTTEIFKYESKEINSASSTINFTIDNFNINDLPQYEYANRQHFKEKDREESEDIYCRSIINFGQLLLHTYRIHLKIEGKNDFNHTFHVNKLIEIFKDLEKRKDSQEIKRFFLLLWDIRYLFDKYIIKWISDINDKTESLEIINFNLNDKGYYSRSNYGKSESLMLQSVLYFTGDYLRQYWLSSYLDYLYYNHNNKSATEKIHLDYLEKMDNVFSLDKSKTDKELSWLLMHLNSEFKSDLNIKEYLNHSKGTGFKHYWFQKLEYILWKNWSPEKTEEFNNYRITSRNSIEHIYPQNPENRDQHPVLDEEHLHSFGNLVLLSVTQNSEYSNKSVSVKKSMFQEKRNTYDTLKSYYLFKNDVWTSKEIQGHKNEMIELILNHYDK